MKTNDLTDMRIAAAHIKNPECRDYFRKVIAWIDAEIAKGGDPELLAFAAGRHISKDPELVAELAGAYEMLILTKEGLNGDHPEVMH